MLKYRYKVKVNMTTRSVRVNCEIIRSKKLHYVSLKTTSCFRENNAMFSRKLHYVFKKI